ncbi:MAG: LysR family transcriptional regulator [Bdellovibrionota bacterium]
MLTENLNLNELRVFATVFRTGGMTSAAVELHLTQSGVSQHISRLETELGVKLFDRLKRRLYPTPAARELFEACRQGFETLERTLLNIKGGKDALVGTLRLGMPQEFGASVIAPLLGEFATEHPGLKFELHFEYSQAILQELVRGDLDFAFVDEFSRHPSVTIEPVYKEILDLCVSKELLASLGKPQHRREYYEKLDYLDYESAHPLCLKWFQHHLGTESLRLNMRAIVPSMQGISTLIASHMGAGILPRHVSWRLHKQTSIHVFQAKSAPLSNTIALAQIQGRTNSVAVTRLAKWLKSRLLKASIE